MLLAAGMPYFGADHRRSVQDGATRALQVEAA
jgi:hypothetical protein